MKTLFASNLLILSCLFNPACGSSHRPAELASHIKSPCEVSFRRGDALGSGGSLPVPPLTQEINGATVSISGVLMAVDEQGILLHDDATKGDHWIPLTAILRVSFPSP